MREFLTVFIGAGLGGVLRHGVNLLSVRWLGAQFPWHTLGINVLGSFCMGLLVSWLALRSGAWSENTSSSIRLFFATGVLGGFTTFSAFSLDAVSLWQRGDMALALGYAAASVLLSIAALAFALCLAR